MKISIVLIPLLCTWTAGLTVPSGSQTNPKSPTLPSTVLQKTEDIDCCILSGVWGNQHGSIVRLNHTKDGMLNGRFSTAVESKAGASGGVQNLHGVAGSETPTTFGFSVSYKGGSSTAAWSGQYLVCNGEETLLTTWTLTSMTKTGKCEDTWMATRVGQDRFVRKHDWQDITPRDSSRKFTENSK